jgi:enoyl-CoA hydratase/carnithine racemase
VSASDCLHLGVFDELADPNDVLPRALELAASLAAFPPEVYARTKRELRAATAARLRTAAAEDPLLEI